MSDSILDPLEPHAWTIICGIFLTICNFILTTPSVCIVLYMENNFKGNSNFLEKRRLIGLWKKIAFWIYRVTMIMCRSALIFEVFFSKNNDHNLFILICIYVFNEQYIYLLSLFSKNIPNPKNTSIFINIAVWIGAFLKIRWMIELFIIYKISWLLNDIFYCFSGKNIHRRNQLLIRMMGVWIYISWRCFQLL